MSKDRDFDEAGLRGLIKGMKVFDERERCTYGITSPSTGELIACIGCEYFKGECKLKEMKPDNKYIKNIKPIAYNLNHNNGKCRYGIYSPSTLKLISCTGCKQWIKGHCIIDDIGDEI